MSGFCSAHWGYRQEGCPACEIDVDDLGPLWEAKKAEAEAAGLHQCACGFEYYRTVSFCPLCARNLPGVCPEHEFYRHACLGCRRGVQT